MKLIQILLTGLLVAISVAQKEKPEGDVSTRLFLGPGGVGETHSGFGSIGHQSSFGQGSSRPQRPFVGGISGGIGHGGRPTIGGVGSHGSFGGSSHVGQSVHGSFGGGFPGDSHVGGSGSNCRYWCNQDNGKVYCCEYDSDPLQPVGEKFGKCPPVRPTCPGTKFGPERCSNDFSCPGIDKCCFDKCLDIAVCKKPIDYLFPDKGFQSGTGFPAGGHGAGIIGEPHGPIIGGAHGSGIGSGAHGSGFGGVHGSGIGGVHGSGLGGGGIHRPGIGGSFPGSGIGGGINRPGVGGGFREPGFGGGINRPGIDSGLQTGIHRPGVASLHGSGVSAISHGSAVGGFHQGSGFGTGGGGLGHNIGSFARKKNN